MQKRMRTRGRIKHTKETGWWGDALRGKHEESEVSLSNILTGGIRLTVTSSSWCSLLCFFVWYERGFDVHGVGRSSCGGCGGFGGVLSCWKRKMRRKKGSWSNQFWYHTITTVWDALYYKKRITLTVICSIVIQWPHNPVKPTRFIRFSSLPSQCFLISVSSSEILIQNLIGGKEIKDVEISYILYIN